MKSLIPIFVIILTILFLSEKGSFTNLSSREDSYFLQAQSQMPPCSFDTEIFEDSNLEYVDEEEEEEHKRTFKFQSIYSLANEKSFSINSIYKLQQQMFFPVCKKQTQLFQLSKIHLIL
jgi:hypothetical protein